MAESAEGSSSSGPRKRIHYNDSSLKTGGGGTGLLYGASDKSSSSSKQFNKKSSVSSNSSGVKDVHMFNPSENSSSEKSDQRHFDRLIKRNELFDFCEVSSDPVESTSNNEPYEGE